MVKEAFLIRWHTVTDLLIDLGSRTLKRPKLVELGDGDGVLNPCKKLLGRDDPHCRKTN